MVTKIRTKKPLGVKPISKTSLRTVPFESGFQFYTAIGNYTGITATSLNEFAAKLQTIPLESITFHFQRKDFQKWIENTIEDTELAEKMDGINNGLSAEDLRKEILSTVQTSTAWLRSSEESSHRQRLSSFPTTYSACDSSFLALMIEKNDGQQPEIVKKP